MLAEAPSENLWRRLCDLLDDWPDHKELRATVIPYVEERLTPWPDMHRFAPARWLAALLRDEPPHPALALCRALRIPNPSRWLPGTGRPYPGAANPARSWRTELFSPKPLARLLQDRALHHIGVLGLGGVRLSSKLLDALTQAPLHHLHALSLAQTDFDAHELERILQAPLAQGLTHLDLQRAHGMDADSAQILKKHWPTPLRQLNLSFTRMSAASMARLLDLDAAQNLTELTLAGIHNNASGILLTLLERSLALERLRLHRLQLDHDGLLALSTSPNLTALRHLHMVGINALADPHHTDALTQGPLLGQLHTLQLEHTAAGGDRLANALPRGSRLRTFQGRRIGLTDAGLHALAASAAALTKLRLSDNAIGPKGLTCALEHIQPTDLELNFNPIADAGLIALAKSPAAARLCTLRAVKIGATGKGLSALAKSPHLGNLHTLSLSNNALGKEGVAALAQARSLRPRHLSVPQTQLDADALNLLLRAPSLQHLQILNIYGLPIDHDVAQTLLEADWAPYLNHLRLPEPDQLPPKVLEQLLGADLPQHLKHDLRLPEPDPWRWQALDAARLPPCDHALERLEALLAPLTLAEKASQTKARALIERWWVEPWRSQALARLETPQNLP